MKFADVFEFESQTIITKTGAAICLADLTEREQVLGAASHMNVLPTIFGPESKEVRHLRAFEFIVADHSIAQELVLLFEQHEVDGDGISPRFWP